MSYPVRYSSRSYEEYEELLDYIEKRFGIAKAAEVDLYFESIIDLISINPLISPYSDKRKHLRRCVVSPQTTIYYRFTGEYVEIASFRGNKMNPKTLGL